MSAADALASLRLQPDEKGLLAPADRDAFFKQLKQDKPENKICFDCGARNASWLSVSFAVFVCLNCSGSHRSLGSKISFVRSCDLDHIRPEEAIRMELGGNGRARQYFRSHGITPDNKGIDYRSRIAERYRRQLDNELNELLTEKRPDLLSSSAVTTWEEESAEGWQASGTFNTADQSSSEKAQSGGLANVFVSKSPVVVYAGDGPRTDSSSMKPKEDFDFDFDSAFDSGAAIAEQSSKEKKEAGNRFFLKVNLEKVEEDTEDCFGESVSAKGKSRAVLPPRDLSNAKSISAQDFRQENQQDAEASDDFHANLAKFKDADCISSDAFYGNANGGDDGAGRAGAWDDQLSTQMSILRDSAIQKASEVAVVAQETFRSAANWFSRVTQ